MMRKSKILYYSILFVSLACFVLDLIFNFEFFRISFGASLILMGLWLIVRAFSHKIDSGLFLGITLLGFGALNLTGYFLNRYLNFDNKGLWPYYLFVLSLSILVTGLYFKDKKQFKFCILFLGFGLICLLFMQKLIALWLMIVLLSVWFVLYFVINIILSRKRRK